MNRFRLSVVSAALFLVVTVTCVLMTSHKSAAQNPGPSVTIASPLPLPVTGTLSFAGGSAVTVNNPATSPVLVRDVDNPARQPVQAEGSCNGTLGGCLKTIYTVPAGKRLVIEYASMRANIPVGEVAELLIDTVVGDKVVRNGLPPTAPSVAFLGFSAANMGQQVRLYADPGTIVNVEAFRSASGNEASFDFTISGHLVDVP
jgi:hypothetical protein